MDLRVKRLEFSDDSTIGELSIDGEFECYTLEDKVKPLRFKGFNIVGLMHGALLPPATVLPLLTRFQ